MFHGKKSRQLEIQMILLLLKLLQVSSDRTPSRLPNRSQPSKEFSPCQNLRLCCEAFGVIVSALCPFSTLDLVRVRDEVARSRLCGEHGRVKAQDIEQQALRLMDHLPIAHLKDGLVSRSDLLFRLSTNPNRTSLRRFARSSNT